MKAARWHTRLGRWVSSYGTRRLAVTLGVTSTTIRHWVAGRCPPRPRHAAEVLKLAHGRLTYSDIYTQAEKVRGSSGT